MENFPGQNTWGKTSQHLDLEFPPKGGGMQLLDYCLICKWYSLCILNSCLKGACTDVPSNMEKSLDKEVNVLACLYFYSSWGTVPLHFIKQCIHKYASFLAGKLGRERSGINTLNSCFQIFKILQ